MIMKTLKVSLVITGTVMTGFWQYYLVSPRFGWNPVIATIISTSIQLPYCYEVVNQLIKEK